MKNTNGKLKLLGFFAATTPNGTAEMAKRLGINTLALMVALLIKMVRAFVLRQ